MLPTDVATVPVLAPVHVQVTGPTASPSTAIVPLARAADVHVPADLLSELSFVLYELGLRYPELPASVIRAEALEVLCLGSPERLTPPLVARVVEARLHALL